MIAHNSMMKNDLALWGAGSLLVTGFKGGLYSATLDGEANVTSAKQWLGLINLGEGAIAYHVKTNQFLYLGDEQFILLDSTGKIVATAPYPGYLAKGPNQIILTALDDSDYFLLGEANPFTTGKPMGTFTFQRIAENGVPRNNSVRYFSFPKTSSDSDSLLAATYDLGRNQIWPLFGRYHYTNDNSDLYSVRVNTLGIPTSKPLLVASKIQPTLTVGLGQTRTGFVIGYERAGKLYVRELGLGAQPLGKEMPVSDQSYFFIENLGMASGTAKDRFLLYWHGNISNGPINIYGQLIAYGPSN